MDRQAKAVEGFLGIGPARGNQSQVVVRLRAVVSDVHGARERSFRRIEPAALEMSDAIAHEGGHDLRRVPAVRRFRFGRALPAPAQPAQESADLENHVACRERRSSAPATASMTGDHAPRRGCRNRRTDGYQIMVSPAWP